MLTSLTSKPGSTQSARNTSGSIDHLSQIYLQFPYEIALSYLNPKRSSSSRSSYVVCDCPICGASGEAFIYRNGRQIICNRKNSCGAETSIWDYVQNKYGLNNSDTLKKMAELATYPLPEISEEYIQKIETERTRASIIKAVFEEYRKNASSANDYLSGTRKYSDDDILNMDIGWNPGFTKTIAALEKKGISGKDIKDALNFIESRDNYPIVFLYHDERGSITTIWGRTLDPKVEDGDKYKPFSNCNKAVPFYLNKARGSRELVLTEGYFDPMISHARGLTNVIGIGGSRLPNEQLETLIKWGCNRIYLALDNDEEAGPKGTEAIIKKLCDTNIEVFVVKYLHKDPDEYIIKSKDIRYFKDDIKAAQIGYKWLADRIIGKDEIVGRHDIKTDVGRIKARDEILSFAKKTNPINRLELLQYVSMPLNLPPNCIEIYEKEIKELEQKEQESKLWEDYAKQVDIFVKGGNFEALIALPKPQIYKGDSHPLKLIEFIKDKTVDYWEVPPIKPSLLKYENQTFLHKGIVAELAGFGGVGKTHFISQLAISIVTGTKFLDTYDITNPGYVAVFVGEGDEADMQRSIYKAINLLKNKHNKIDEEIVNKNVKDKLSIRSVRGRDATLIESRKRTEFYNNLLEQLIKNQPKEGWAMIILDPISRFLGADAENDNAAATAFIALLENLTLELKGEPTIFFTHHMAKSAQNKSQTDSNDSRGSSAIPAGARWQANLVRVADPILKKTEEDNEYLFKIVKTNYTKEFELTLIKNDEGSLVAANKKDFEDKDNKTIRDKKIIDKMASEYNFSKKTIEEISKKMAISISNVHKAIPGQSTSLQHEITTVSHSITRENLLADLTGSTS